MNITNDSTGNPDFVGYFTKQFLTDLGRMAELRDELAKRQGALTAVEDAIKVKSKADSYALTKQAEIDGILDAAKVSKAEAETLAAKLKADAKAFETKVTAVEAALDTREKDLAAKEKKVDANQAAVERRSSEINAANDKLQADSAALELRVKAFQAKVAAINV
jgi:chromosome segregation ATPase